MSAPAAAVLARALRRRPPAWLLAGVGAAVTIVAVVAIARTVDGDALRRALRAAGRDMPGLSLVVAALLAAFTLRARAWTRLLPRLAPAQALAAIHLAMGANHVLPFRLGEPLRVASAVRRGAVDPTAAAATTIVLRLADVITLVALGALVAPVAFSDLLGPWGWLATCAVGGTGAASWWWLRRLVRAGREARLPDAGALVLTASAWLLESVAVWQAMRWAGVELGPRGAVLVTATAVSAQVVAVAPSGFGTYEAAAVAALVALGHDPGVALAAALTAHACKTAYSLVAGGVALALPRPATPRA